MDGWLGFKKEVDDKDIISRHLNKVEMVIGLFYVEIIN